MDQTLLAVTAAIAAPFQHPGVASGCQCMGAAAAAVAVRRRLGLLHIEAVRHPGWKAEQFTHHGLPFAPMGLEAARIVQMKDQPVSHLVGDDVIEESGAIITQQNRVEAQPASAHVRLPGRSTSQIKPHARARKRRVDLQAAPPRFVNAPQGGLVQGISGQCVQIALQPGRQCR